MESLDKREELSGNLKSGLPIFKLLESNDSALLDTNNYLCRHIRTLLRISSPLLTNHVEKKAWRKESPHDRTGQIKRFP